MPGSPEHFPKSATRFSGLKRCDKTKNWCEVNPDIGERQQEEAEAIQQSDNASA